MPSSDYSLSVLPHSPVAKKQPKTLITHDKKRIDDYYWMRDDERKNEKVLAHLQAENNYCD